MNHILKNSPGGRAENVMTYNNPNLPVMPGLIDVISAFVKK